MTGESGTPNSRPDPNQGRPVPRRKPPARSPVTPYRPTTGKVPTPRSPMPRPMERPSQSPVTGFVNHLASPQPIVNVEQRSPVLPPPPPPLSPTDSAPSLPLVTRKPTRFGWLVSWQLWVILTMLLIGGAGSLSAALLLKLPSIPNCPSIFWPTASGSLRLYCAQLAANKRTVDDLLEAIALVNSLPQDHPLRPEINRSIEEWAKTILEMAEQAFQEGELETAIATARRIPDNTTAHQLVADRIQRWESIWTEATGIYQKAEAAIQKQDLAGAFSIAIRLLYVGNTYWQTTKYQELNNLLTVARLEGGKLSRAMTLARRGRMTNLLAAIKLLEAIRTDSPAYAQSRRLLKKVGQQLLDLAESQLERRDGQEALAIARQIPSSAGMVEEVKDFIQLATAQEQAWEGTVSDLETAIIQAQRIDSDRPLYSKAQQLISRWQLEIGDVAHLATARQLAQPGTVGDLTAAIAEARLIPESNPRWSDARREIEAWTVEIQTIEDRPFLDEAERLASSGTADTLQAAIDQANRIQRGRALYEDARRQVRTWTAQIQRIQDQPYLDRAEQQATAGNLDEAIAIARQVASGRALYEDAQSSIRQWQGQIDAGNLMRRAYSSAGGGMSTNLLEAIRTADQVPAGSSLRSDADRMITIWSQEILRIAELEAQYSLDQAIATASTIPSRTEAYAAAQLRIRSWQQELTPAPPALVE